MKDQEPGTTEVTLYAYYDGLFERWEPFPFVGSVPVPNENINKHKIAKASPDVIDEGTAKNNLMVDNVIKQYSQESYNNDDEELAFASTDKDYTNYHKNVAYYDAELEKNHLAVKASFNQNKGVLFVKIIG